MASRLGMTLLYASRFLGRSACRMSCGARTLGAGGCGGEGHGCGEGAKQLPGDVSLWGSGGFRGRFCLLCAGDTTTKVTSGISYIGAVPCLLGTPVSPTTSLVDSLLLTH